MLHLIDLGHGSVDCAEQPEQICWAVIVPELLTEWGRLAADGRL